MKILDSNHIPGQTLSAEICIIGAGPAGITLARKLCESHMEVVIADSGGRSYGKEPDELNVMKVESDFIYRNGESKRARQIGGTASIWAGRIVPFDFHPEFDSQWGSMPDSVIPCYDETFRQLNIDPAIQMDTGQSRCELYGYWAHKTQRFNASSLKCKQSNGRIYTNLTFTGDAVFNGGRILELFFINRKREIIRISSDRFVFAMGGIENSRMLLVMGDQIEKRMGKNFRNVGKYIMDHPRISHGTFIREAGRPEIARYQMRATNHGIYKTGIRNRAVNTRVYANLFGSPGKITRKVLRLPIRTFQHSSRRLLLKETGLLRTLANQCKTLPLVKSSVRMKSGISRFVNNRVYDKYSVMTYCEQRPREQNQIVLDHTTDRNHVRIPRLVNHIHHDELNEVMTFYAELESLAGNPGCIFRFDRKYVSNPANFTDSSHIIGGTRYSVDESRSVVDHELRVIGIPNLHITGSSVFPTSGVENPTHLIVSLSLYLAGILKNGSVKA